MSLRSCFPRERFDFWIDILRARRDARLGKKGTTGLFGGHVLEKTRIHNAEFESRLLYVTDPDGTRLELVEVPNDPTR